MSTEADFDPPPNLTGMVRQIQDLHAKLTASERARDDLRQALAIVAGCRGTHNDEVRVAMAKAALDTDDKLRAFARERFLGETAFAECAREAQLRVLRELREVAQSQESAAGRRACVVRVLEMIDAIERGEDA